MIGRPYKKSDLKHVERIWSECGWISGKKEEKESLKIFLNGGDPYVYETNKNVECFVQTNPAEFNYNETTLPHCAVCAVTASRVIRRQGIAKKLLAEALSTEAAKGFVTSGLGIFEQGFYDLLGYGTTWYEHWIDVDPVWFNVPVKHREPVRLSKDDIKDIIKNRNSRTKIHGAITIPKEDFTLSEMVYDGNYGLGYRDNKGRLTHHFWFRAQGESGPYRIKWFAYETFEQFLELLALVQSFGDQVRKIIMREPSWIQIQDYIKKPFQLMEITSKGKYECKTTAVAYHQLRILDLYKAIEAVKYKDNVLEFNLKISDPIEDLVPENSKWKGCGGEFTVSLSSHSTLVKGYQEGLPVLESDIASFSRLWAGVLDVEALALSGKLKAPNELIQKLSLAFPRKYGSPDWDY